MSSSPRIAALATRYAGSLSPLYGNGHRLRVRLDPETQLPVRHRAHPVQLPGFDLSCGQQVRVDDLVALVERSTPRLGATRLVAVDGPGGAGKSTLAAQLATVCGATLLHTDDFASWDYQSDWWPRLEQLVLAPIARGQAGRYQRYDWDAQTAAEWHEVAPPAVLILGGGVRCARLCAKDFRCRSGSRPHPGLDARNRRRSNIIDRFRFIRLHDGQPFAHDQLTESGTEDAEQGSGQQHHRVGDLRVLSVGSGCLDRVADRRLRRRRQPGRGDDAVLQNTGPQQPSVHLLSPLSISNARS